MLLEGGGGYCTVGNDFNNNGVRKNNIYGFLRLSFLSFFAKLKKPTSIE